MFAFTVQPEKLGEAYLSNCILFAQLRIKCLPRIPYPRTHKKALSCIARVSAHFHLLSRYTMPAGPFASSAGVGRAEPEWAELNKVSSVCGHGMYLHMDRN